MLQHAAMPLLATGEAQTRADEMAARMLDGMNKVMSDLGVSGLAYGDSSICLYFGATVWLVFSSNPRSAQGAGQILP